MDIEQLLNLFDSFWFERETFNRHPFPSNPQNPQSENPLKDSPSPLEESSIPRIRTRSISEDLSSKLSFMSNSNSNSPDSVLFSPKLETILSSKDIAGAESPEMGTVRRRKTESRNRVKGRRRRGPEISKSLSELEFEELKGFMDLGFVFSEEDKDSRLASIVPGLNRLGKMEEQEQEQEPEEKEKEIYGEISRPYLSEVWEAMEKEEEKLKKPLMMKMMKLKFPANEIDMKDNLKWWAHAVASTVR